VAKELIKRDILVLSMGCGSAALQLTGLCIATSAAFAFSRMKFYGREWGLVLFLAIQSFPGVLSLIPIAQLLTAIGGYGKIWGLILA
jgi:arabinogalactan oligomer/maltooligosaccharide transport system permease protein